MNLEALISTQDGIVTRRQALEELSDNALHHRLQRQWRILLPGVYLSATGSPTRRQQLRAALLYAGSGAQLSDHTALAAFGVRYLPADASTYLLIPAGERRMSRDGVTVRRTTRLPIPRVMDGMPFSPPARALADFAARYGDERASFAAIADAVQRRVTSAADVIEELAHVTGRGNALAARLATRLADGARSTPESDFLKLCKRSSVLPAPMVNALIELPDGRCVSPDALFEDAALVHETNGRSAHAAQDQFEGMQERHGAMTTAGLTVLHSSPYQLRKDPQRILDQLEACYLRDRGKGLPPGITVLRGGADGPFAPL
jgi:hypothetical protein